VLKTLGYVISTLSVILLGVVSWKATESDMGLRACLIAGAFASILGMFCRWLSYELEKRHSGSAERRDGSAAHALTGSVGQQGISRG
jgi:hypothetical protein